MTIYKQSVVTTVLFVLLGLITVSAIAQPVCGTPKTQSQLLTEWQTCAQQGLSAGCLTAQRVQDIICAIPGGTTTNILSSNSFGSVCDGGTHPLSGYYGSLGAAQAVYPFITSLSQEIDYAALQKMSNVALGAAGSENGSNTNLNKSMIIQGTCNIANDTWLIRNADGISISGSSATATGITGNGIVLQFDGLWYSNLSNFYIGTTSSSAVVALDIDGNVPGHPYSTRSVQSNTFTNLLVNGGGSSEAIAICRQGGSGGQCSEMVWINLHCTNASFSCYYQYGFNAIDNVLVGGDIQNYQTNGIYLSAGSIKIYGMSFESTTGYTQLANGGCDISAQAAGVEESIIVDGIRSESLCVYNGAWSQWAVIRGVRQSPAAFLNWTATTNYSLNQVTQQLSSDNNYYMYRVTTAGQSGGSTPIWPTSGTVSDGGVVWTQTPYNAVTVAEGDVDLKTSLFAYSAGIKTGSALNVASCGSSPIFDTDSTRWRGSITEGSGATGCSVALNNWQIVPKPVCVVSSPSGATLTSYNLSLLAGSVWNLVLVNPSPGKFSWICTQ